MFKIGIQGDKGSNNEKACLEFCKRQKITDYKIKYLISTENVLKNLQEEKIDFGVFAYKTMRKGLVAETEEAMKKYSFTKVNEVEIEMNMALLAKKQMKKSDFQFVYSHPQALEENVDYLKQAYPQADLIAAQDTALAARKLQKGKYDDYSLVIAPIECASIYNLEILEADLPANKGYFTTFWMVK